MNQNKNLESVSVKLSFCIMVVLCLVSLCYCELNLSVDGQKVVIVNGQIVGIEKE